MSIYLERSAAHHSEANCRECDLLGAGDRATIVALGHELENTFHNIRLKLSAEDAQRELENLSLKTNLTTVQARLLKDIAEGR